MNYLMKRHLMMKNKDGRNEYGSKEGYVDQRGMDYRSDYRGDYRGDYRSDYSGDYNYYESGRTSDYRGQDYNRGSDYRGQDYRGQDYRGQDYRSNDYRGQDYHSEEQLMSMYKQDLEKWTHKLKEKDRFKLPNEEVIKKAKNMGVAFMDYTENEFYVMYLLMLSLFKSIANEPHTYLAMAKSALEDPSSSLSPSEKVQVIMYEIAMGGRPSF